MSGSEPARRMSGSSMNIWRSLRGLPRDLWIVAIASLVNRAGTMVLPFLVLYLTRQLGFSAPRAGFALAVYGAGSIIASPIAGRFSDLVGPLPIMRFSLIGTGFLLLIFPFVKSFEGVIALTFAWALVSEAFRPANLAMIAEVVPQEQLKPAYALIRLAINLGMSIGPAVAGFIAARSFSWIFVVDAVTTLAAGAVLLATPIVTGKRRRADATGDREGKGRLPEVFGDRRMLLFLAALFLVGIVFFQHEGALPLFLVQDLQLSPAFYGMLFTVNTVMIVFLEVPLNAATAHWPHRRGLAIGAMLFAIGSGAFAFASGPAMVIVGIVVWTFGEMLLFPQASAYVAEIAPPHRRGQYMGAYSLAFSLAFAVAPWAGTATFAHYGAKALWIGVCAIGAISAAMMLFVTSQTQETDAVAA
ncbi:MAG: MFS transporter [Gemmatimonadales bacterium]